MAEMYDIDVRTNERRDSQEDIIAKSELDPVWVRRGNIISAISIALTLASAIAGIVIAVKDGSIAVLSYGIESALDIVTSVIVLWRLRDTHVVHLPQEHLNFQSKRDTQAAVVISFLFFALGTYLCVHSIVNLYHHEAPDTAVAMIVLAAISIVAYALLGAAKFIVAKNLNSLAFRKDALVTFSSCILSTGILVGGLVYHNHPNAFWIDATVALMVGVWMAFYGLSSIATNPWSTTD
eukprot:TRINITY_DN5281_c0_g1_i1.p1 TRINITY_DN5281_c0_g1~~TRINITY_DN5281_c0_g1_i1.p1  ORF type:complete len:237 (-),score=30.34 TRINITY_DN5281_c0_g1_i1:1-711(-)